ncbi:CLAVATA3/ESR (CLE)-related protein 25 [Linum grandiflorum]
MGKGSSSIFSVISRTVLLLGIIWFLYVGVVASHAANRKLQRNAVASSTGKHHSHQKLDLHYVSKRRVPNGPDPIHNSEPCLRIRVPVMRDRLEENEDEHEEKESMVSEAILKIDRRDVIWGIDRKRVERMEARLKEDILRESERYGGAIMVIHETEDGQIFDAWEHVNSESVKTPLEVFRCLEADGSPVKYARVPITDGKVPKSSDFDILATNIASAPQETAFVFNCQVDALTNSLNLYALSILDFFPSLIFSLVRCLFPSIHMGRGRTTTGTVIACLVKLRVEFGKPIKVLHDDINHEEEDTGSSSGEDNGGNSGPTTNNTEMIAEREQVRAFGIDDILLLCKITRLFDNGVECREALDATIT